MVVKAGQPDVDLEWRKGTAAYFLSPRPAELPESWGPALCMLDAADYLTHLVLQQDARMSEHLAQYTACLLDASRLVRAVPEKDHARVLRVYRMLADHQITIGALIRLGETSREPRYRWLGTLTTRLLEGDGFPHYDEVVDAMSRPPV